MIKIFKNTMRNITQLEEEINKFLEVHNLHLNEYDLDLQITYEDELLAVIEY